MRQITHLFAPVSGGVEDYVNIITAGNNEFVKLPICNDFDTAWSRRNISLLHYSGYGFAKRGAPFWLKKK